MLLSLASILPQVSSTPNLSPHPRLLQTPAAARPPDVAPPISRLPSGLRKKSYLFLFLSPSSTSFTLAFPHYLEDISLTLFSFFAIFSAPILPSIWLVIKLIFFSRPLPHLFCVIYLPLHPVVSLLVVLMCMMGLHVVVGCESHTGEPLFSPSPLELKTC